MATHSSLLVWEIPWTEEPGRLQSMGLQRVRHDWKTELPDWQKYTEGLYESESEVTQSCPTLCDPWTVAHQAPPSMGFSRQEYWSGLPFPSPIKSLSHAFLTIEPVSFAFSLYSSWPLKRITMCTISISSYVTQI